MIPTPYLLPQLRQIGAWSVEKSYPTPPRAP